MQTKQKQQTEQQRIQKILNAHLTQNDRKIYNFIKDHPSTKKDLTNRSKFPSNLIDKITNVLSGYNLIKKIKKPESKNLNVWVVFGYIVEQTATINQTDKDDLMELVRKREGSVALSQLQKEVLRKGIKMDMLEEILLVLELRGQIYNTNGKIIPRKPQIINSPCVQCNLRQLCRPESQISPQTCPYMISW